MNKAISFLLLLLIVFTFSSCTRVLMNTMGVEEIKQVDTNKINAFYEKNNLQTFPHLLVDTTYYDNIRAFAGSDSLLLKNLYQPLRVYYFDKEKLVSLHLNCNAADSTKMNIGSVSKLNWNAYGRFEVFPPISSMELTSFDLNISALEQQLNNPFRNPNKRYTIVVVWTNLLPKQSRLLIQQVQENMSRFPSDAQLILVNSDALYADAEFGR